MPRTKTPPPAVAPVVRQAAEGRLVKFAQRLADGALVESVLIPMRARDGRPRDSLCLSTQAGCRMGCRFCATGRAGFVRDLSAAEIAGQVAAARALGREPANLVFMGMGEPFENFDAWAEAVRMLSEPRGAPISRSRMIVSTCGIVPGIERYAALGWRHPVLAVSLNAADDELRSALMPVNRRWPLAVLREALVRALGWRVLMIEYVLLRGVNDRPADARTLAEYLRPLHACVNLIAYNPPPDGDDAATVLSSKEFAAPAPETVLAFRDALREAGQFVKLRAPQGQKIAAGCGQLAGAPVSPP